MRLRTLTLLLPWLLLAACDPADDVRVQELPSLTRSSIEARLGLPELQGPWRFAGWELAEGDTLGLEAELPALGVLWLQAQKRDSLAGFYLTAGGGRAPLQGEVRRNGVVALVTFPQAGDGRYLVGSVQGDTLWVEATTLVEPGAWRGDARAAFVRSQTALTPFRRVRGLVPAPTAADSAALAARMDSLAPGAPPGATAGGMIGQLPVTVPGRAGARQPADPSAASRNRPSRPVTPPVPTEGAAAEAQAGARPELDPRRAEPELEPAVVEPEPPRVLGVPVVRDTAEERQSP